jgi:hypothetical protein
MELINNLLETAQYLKLENTVYEIEALKARRESDNQLLVLPVVGEFSSGKTTLINALTNSKKLETASKATTSVIYEIYFGNPQEKGEIIYNNGSLEEVEDLGVIKNDQLDNVQFIRIYDTAQKIANSTVIVDTPGLSSNDARHLQALNSYLPNADAILLCIDINQQITNSLIEFIKSAKLTERPIYLVVTKTDSKTQNEVEQAVEYIQKNIELPLDNIVCISALNNQLDDFYKLIGDIQQKKNDIIGKKIIFELEQIRKNLVSQLEELIKSASSPNEMEKERKSKQRELMRLQDNIDKLARDVRNDVEGLNIETSRQFENAISTRLEAIIAKRDSDIDKQAFNAIKGTADLILSNYKDKVRKALLRLAQNRRGTDDAIDLRSLENTDLSFVQMENLSYTMDLYGAGHENDVMIGNIVKYTAIAVTVAGGAGLLARAGAAAAASAAVKGANAVDVVDTVTDVASVASNVKTQRVIKDSFSKKVTKGIKSLNNGVDTINKVSKSVEKASNVGGGFFPSAVGWVTEQFQGKPQRQRAIRNYLSNTLLPEFKGNMIDISSTIITNIIELLHQEASDKVEGISKNIQELEELEREQKVAFNEKINTLKTLKDKLK